MHGADVSNCCMPAAWYAITPALFFDLFLSWAGKFQCAFIYSPCSLQSLLQLIFKSTNLCCLFNLCTNPMMQQQLLYNDWLYRCLWVTPSNKDGVMPPVDSSSNGVSLILLHVFDITFCRLTFPHMPHQKPPPGELNSSERNDFNLFEILFWKCFNTWGGVGNILSDGIVKLCRNLRVFSWKNTALIFVMV